MHQPNTHCPHRLRPLGAVIGLILLCLPGAVAATEVPTTISGDLDIETIETIDDLGLAKEGEAVALSLTDAIEIALKRNLLLQVERYNRSRSLLGITEATGIYDFNLESFLGADSDESPPTSVLQQTGGEADVTDRLVFNNSLSRLTPFGGTGTLSFNNSRQEFSDRARTINPLFAIGLDFEFVQPLLRNFGRTVTEQNLLIARNDSGISRETFQIQVETVISQVIDSYWGLVEAREQLKVAEESLTLAKELDGMNRIQVEVGTLAPLELVQSEAGVASREEDIIRRRADVEDRADTLRQLLNLNRGLMWDLEIFPVTDPEIAHEPIDVRSAVDTALANRPDVKQQMLSNDSLGIRAQVARNQLKPRLDVSATYGFNGLDGDLFDRETGGLVEPGGYSDTFDQITGNDFPGWAVGLTFAYPLQNTVAKAQLAQAELAADQGSAQMQQLELQVLTEVRRAARGVETAAKQIDSARVSSKLERRNLDAERKRYENGLSTSFQILQIQEDLSEARSREVSAVISYRRALSSYHQAIGKMLEEYGVELAEPSEAEE